MLTILTSIGEAMLYAVMGQLVDWLATQDVDDFLAQQWPVLASMAVFILVLIPLVVLLKSFVEYQTLMGNFPMIVRWMAHRYLLNQSYVFFKMSLVAVLLLR